MIIVDSYKYRKYLLDFFPAAVAFSLRKLRSGQAKAIRVRRSSDNTEQDIGFIGDDLDTVSLLSFCGAGNGFVTTWYDQSGNAMNAIQNTQANQPKIVNGGVVITGNGKPSILFAGAASSSLNSAVSATGVGTYTGDMTVFFTGIRSGSGGAYFTERTSGLLKTFEFLKMPYDPRYYITSDGTNLQSNHVINVLTYNLTANFFVSTHKYTVGIRDVLFINGQQAVVLLGIGSPITGNAGFSVGKRHDVEHNWDGLISELLVYNTDQTSNRTAIESNINTHYTIY